MQISWHNFIVLKYICLQHIRPYHRHLACIGKADKALLCDPFLLLFACYLRLPNLHFNNQSCSQNSVDFMFFIPLSLH